MLCKKKKWKTGNDVLIFEWKIMGATLSAAVQYISFQNVSTSRQNSMLYKNFCTTELQTSDGKTFPMDELVRPLHFDFFEDTFHFPFNMWKYIGSLRNDCEWWFLFLLTKFSPIIYLVITYIYFWELAVFKQFLLRSISSSMCTCCRILCWGTFFS